jgi:hypothetical protein
VGSWLAIISPCGEVSAPGTRLSQGLAYFFVFLTVFRGEVAFLAAGLAFCAPGFGASPITDLTGQILKMGHFGQPTAIAMGQRVMVGFEFGR